MNELYDSNEDRIDSFVDSLFNKLKKLSFDLKFDVVHENTFTIVTFSGSNLKEYYSYQIASACEFAKLSKRLIAVVRRGNTIIVKIKN